jgi:hypothetical protein
MCHLILALLLSMNGPGGAAKLDLESLAWLEGHWEAAAFGGTVEEVWLPAGGNSQHGVFRLIVDGEMKFSEFLQVTEEDAGVVLRFEHFNPDYTTWEGAGDPMELKLTEASADRLVFEALNEDTPSQIIYLRTEVGMEVTVTGLDGAIEFKRRR